MDKKKFARPLIDDYTTTQFLSTVLNRSDKDSNFEFWKNKIIKIERSLNKVGSNSTYESSKHRFFQYRKNYDRIELRKQIINELLTKDRLKNDDEIKLGKGGALPPKIKDNKEVYILIGSPASGKSTIANQIADETGSIILDSDYVKRKLPEFQKKNGASLVHKESSKILFGNFDEIGSVCVEDVCIENNFNILIPTIGDRQEKIEKIIENYKQENYSVHLILVSLEREISTNRAFDRFLKTDRYVPLSLVFDVYGNDSIICYYRLKKNNYLSSYGKISTLKPNPTFIESSVNGIIEKLYKEVK